MPSDKSKQPQPEKASPPPTYSEALKKLSEARQKQLKELLDLRKKS